MQGEELLVLLDGSLEPAFFQEKPGNGQLGIAEVSRLQPFCLLKTRDGLVPLPQAFITQTQLGVGQRIRRAALECPRLLSRRPARRIP